MGCGTYWEYGSLKRGRVQGSALTSALDSMVGSNTITSRRGRNVVAYSRPAVSEMVFGQDEPRSSTLVAHAYDLSVCVICSSRID